MFKEAEELVKKTLNMLKSKKDKNHLEIYDELMIQASKYFNERELLLIKKAYLIAKDLHRGQKRNSGEPYIIHPVYVAYILLEELNLHDARGIAAALLHDTVEDCGISYDFLKKHFGEYVATLVIGVTKIKEAKFNTKEEQEAFYNCFLLLASLKTYIDILIKIADRLHNMRTLEYKEEAKRRAKSAETLRVFVPLAALVGTYYAKVELANLSLKYLNQKAYQEIDSMRKDYSLKHQNEIEYELELLRKVLKGLSVEAEVEVSLKNNFSIYQHLTKNRKISEIPNLIKYSIMTNTREDCDRIEEEIRTKFMVMEEYTQDFIKNPKLNGYKALHLSIPGHKFIEKNPKKIAYRTSRITGKYIPVQIQIFTKEMFLINSYGFASLSDIYPEKNVYDIQEELLRTNPFFRALQENEMINNPYLFIEKTVRELLADKINVYVADGKIYCLPESSTVADLADKIHSKLREEAIGAKVNGIEVNLDFPLKDGDHVFILTKEEKQTLITRENSSTLKLAKEKLFQ